MLAPFLDAAARSGLELIEQPLPEGADERSRTFAHPVPICADESAHTSADLDRLASRYDAVNIKLDKTGGLTEALAMARRREGARAQDHGRVDGGDLARRRPGAAARQ